MTAEEPAERTNICEDENHQKKKKACIPVGAGTHAKRLFQNVKYEI